MAKHYLDERTGQIEFFKSLRLDEEIAFIDRTDGVRFGTLFEFKLKIDLANMRTTQSGIKCESAQTIDLDLDDTITIKAYDNTEKDIEKRKQRFNRAKSKRETKLIIDEELYR